MIHQSLFFRGRAFKTARVLSLGLYLPLIHLVIYLTPSSIIYIIRRLDSNRIAMTQHTKNLLFPLSLRTLPRLPPPRPPARVRLRVGLMLLPGRPVFHDQ